MRSTVPFIRGSQVSFPTDAHYFFPGDLANLQGHRIYDEMIFEFNERFSQGQPDFVQVIKQVFLPSVELRPINKPGEIIRVTTFKFLEE